MTDRASVQFGRAIDGSMVETSAPGVYGTFYSDHHAVTTKLIRPAIESFTGRVIVLDLNDELFKATSDGRSSHGHHVVRLVGDDTSPYFMNPFDVKGTPDEFEGHAQFLASLIVPCSPYRSDYAQAKHSNALIAGLILYIMHESPPPLRNLSELSYLLSQSPRDYELMIEDMLRVKVPKVKQTAQIYMALPEPLRSRTRAWAQQFAEVFGNKTLTKTLSSTSAFPANSTVYISPGSLQFESAPALLRVWLGCFVQAVLQQDLQNTLIVLPEASCLGCFQVLRDVLRASELRSKCHLWTFWSGLEELQTNYPGESERMLYQFDALQVLDMDFMLKSTRDHLFATIRSGFPEASGPELNGRDFVRLRGTLHELAS